MKKNFALCVEQKKFRLSAALELAQSFTYNLPAPEQNNLEAVIQSLIKEVNKKKKAHT